MIEGRDASSTGEIPIGPVVILSREVDALKDENAKLRAEAEQLHKENLIAWNNWGKELEQTKLQVDELRKELVESLKHGCVDVTLCVNHHHDKLREFTDPRATQKREPEPQNPGRCPSTYGTYRCMDVEGHNGGHWMSGVAWPNTETR